MCRGVGGGGGTGPALSARAGAFHRSRAARLDACAARRGRSGLASARDVARAVERAGVPTQGGRLHRAWRAERTTPGRGARRGRGGMDRGRISGGCGASGGHCGRGGGRNEVKLRQPTRSTARCALHLAENRRIMTNTPRPADIARRSAEALKARPRDVFRRETFALPRAKAREKARGMFRRYPKPAYMTEIASWRELPGDCIEVTMRRLPSAD